MKRTRNNKGLLLVAFALLLLAGCKKEEVTTVSLTRRFSPATIAATNGETSVTIAWSPSLFTTPEDGVEYTAEFSKTADFATIDHMLTTTIPSVVVTDNSLAIKQDYFVRVKANAKEGTSESHWTMGGPFRITGEQFLLPVASNEVIDVGVILRWKPSSTLTKITLTPTGGAPIDVTLTPTDLAATSKTVMGLTQNTDYAAEIFESTKTKGIVAFKTVPSITGVNIIDLSANTTAPANNGILNTTLQANPPSGTVIILRRGEQYSTAGYSFSKSVTIVSALGFGTNLAIIRPTSTFNVVAASVIDSLVFKNLVIKGGRAANASYTSDYVLNVNTASTIKLVRLEGCTIKILRGTIRGQGNPTKYENYFMNNCVLDSINDFSVAAVSNTSSFDNIRMTNSTFYKSLKFINHNVAAPNGRGSLSVLIENCTFNEVVSNAGTAINYLIDYNANNVTNGIVIRNCIFGKTWNTGGTAQQIGYRAGTSTGLTVTNSYSTNDFTFLSSPLAGTLPYSGPATSLFTAPDVGDFKIKDAGFVGKSSTGDPRWRIN